MHAILKVQPELYTCSHETGARESLTNILHHVMLYAHGYQAQIVYTEKNQPTGILLITHLPDIASII